jgi:hypothetical protein
VTQRQEIGTFTDYPSLVALLRRRKDELGLSDAALEQLGEFAPGQVNKMLGPSLEKSLGKITLPIMLDCLGLSGVLYVDPRKVERMSPLWADEGKRRDANVREEHTRVSKVTIRRARQAVLNENASKGGRAAWANKSPALRRRLMRALAKKRYVRTSPQKPANRRVS